MSRARAVAVAVAVALAVIAAGCSGGGSGSVARPGTSATTEAQPQRGGVLRVGIEAPGSFDPAQARSTSELMLADLLYDGLTALDEAGVARPALADRWQSSPDLLQWDFHLRDGVRYSTGRPVTPADVAYSLQRIRQPNGATDLLAAALGSVSEITTPARDLVHFVLREPQPDLPAVLANPGFGVVARETVDGGTLATGPVGSGPFHVAGREGDVVHLLAVPGTPVYLGGIDLHLGALDRNYQSFRSGDLDWSLVPASASAEAAQRAGRDGFVPYLAVLFYGFNLKNPKFADIRFREAIVRAVDRRAIASIVYGGTVTAIDGPVPAGVPGWQDAPCGTRCVHDVAAAKSLVAAVFPAGPPPVAIDFDADPTQEAVARAIQAGLGAAGIRGDLRPHPVGEYAEVVHRGEQELFRLGWVGAAPTPGLFLSPLFRSGSPTNVTGFNSPPIDDVLRAAERAADAAARTELYRDAERRIMDQLPIVPIAQFETLSVGSERLRGLRLTPLGTFDATRVWLAADR